MCGHGDLWAIVANYEPSLSLAAFLANNKGDPSVDNFRRLEFAFLHDWGLFAQIQPADQLNNMVGIFNAGDAGFRTCLSWGVGG